MKCYACGKLVSSNLCMTQGNLVNWFLQGHISRDCTAPNGGPLNAAGKVCYKCGQAGHISRDCAAVDVNGQTGIDGTTDPMAQSAQTVATTTVA